MNKKSRVYSDLPSGRDGDAAPSDESSLIFSPVGHLLFFIFSTSLYHRQSQLSIIKN